MCSGLHSAATWQKPSSKLFLGLNKWSGNRVLKEPLTSSPFTRYLSKLLLSVRLSWRFDYIIQPPCRLAASGRHQCLHELQQQLTFSSFPKKHKMRHSLNLEPDWLVNSISFLKTSGETAVLSTASRFENGFQRSSRLQLKELLKHLQIFF